MRPTRRRARGCDLDFRFGVADRKAALGLSDQQRPAEAVPLLEELAAASPDDVLVQERLGVCLTASASRQDALGIG